MNWGYKILIVYALFVVGIMVLVVKSSSEKMDLVTTDYYGKELKFQQQIDQTKRADALSESLQTELKGHRLLVRFPKDFAGKKITGKADLYCPSDENNDRSEDISLQDSVLIMNIPSTDKGLYELHILCSVNGSSYYFEKRIII
jgi:hypothetical protein